MASDEKKIRRTLHVTFTMPSADSTHLLSLLKSVKPYYALFGDVRVRFFQNADDPTKFVQLIDYETPETIEVNRQQISADPRVQAYLQVWRSLLPTVPTLDVYRELDN